MIRTNNFDIHLLSSLLLATGTPTLMNLFKSFYLNTKVTAQHRYQYKHCNYSLSGNTLSQEVLTHPWGTWDHPISYYENLWGSILRTLGRVTIQFTKNYIVAFVLVSEVVCYFKQQLLYRFSINSNF